MEKPFKRYFYTLFSTIGRIAFAVITSIIVPNAIGPKTMGTIAFGQIIVQNIRGFFDFNFSSTFFNMSASKLHSGGITRLFVKIISSQIIVTFLILILLCFTNVGKGIIQGTPFLILLLLLGIEWAIYLTNLSNQLGDAKGISKWPQILILASNLIMTLIIITLAIFKSLTAITYLITTFTFGVLSCLSVIIYLYQTNHESIWMRVGQENLKNFLKSALKISVPLTIASYFGMGIEFFERFLIQYKYGPEEQSYYYIASRWAAIIIILSSSSLQIFWQNLVKSIAAGDKKRTSETYLRLDGLLFYSILTIALVWSFVGKEILSIMLNKDFAEAGNILVIMSMYPVAQVFGQIGTTVAVASGRSKEYMITSTLTSAFGIVISYFLLVPKSSYIPGLELGSFGLAIKTSFFGLLAVQPITFLNCKYLSISYRKVMLRKIKIFLSLIIILLILTEIGKMFIAFLPVIIESIVRATFFIIASISLIFIKPEFCGVSINDIDKLKNHPVFVRITNIYRK